MNIRKNQKDLTENEWKIFISAVKEIKKENAVFPNYMKIASFHYSKFHLGTAHRNPEFLAWHRNYILVFEKRLQEVNSNVTLPYWNWLKDRKIPEKLAIAKEWNVIRKMKPIDLVKDYSLEINEAMKKDNYSDFHKKINIPHNGIHIDIGDKNGQMGNMEESPEDILFWLHHCFLDKIWSEWQTKHPNLEPNMEEQLLPTAYFKKTGNDVLNIQDLGYKYA